MLCPHVRNNGACSDARCPHHHYLTTCDYCSIVFTSQANYNSHMAGKRHRRTLDRRLYHCEICDRQLQALSWQDHINGRPHAKKAAQSQLATAILPSLVVQPTVPTNHAMCSVCKRSVYPTEWTSHIRSKRHMTAEKYAQLKSVMEDAEMDKHGVTVASSELDFGVVDSGDAALGQRAFFDIATTVPHARIEIVDARLLSSTTSKHFSYFRLDMVTGHNLNFGQTIRGTVVLQQRHNGRCEDRLEVVFKDTLLDQRFVIVRQVKAIVGNSADYDLLRPIKPYVPPVRTARLAETNIIPGIAPSSLNAINYIVKLEKAPIPAQIASVLSANLIEETTRQFKSYLPLKFDCSSYSRHWKNLLWAEEHQSEFDLERYDIMNTTLVKYNSFYYIKVPGLAEKRPSVLVGDRILVQIVSDTPGKWYEGHAHAVRKEEVGLKFHSSFQGWTATKQYHVRFKLNRIPLRRQHQALGTAFSPARVLFPAATQILPLRPAATISLFNHLISSNPPQLMAINIILRQQPGSPPFIVYGPPGTGKTITIVEAIRQLLIKNPNARILACAPSNSAADLITERLSKLGTDVLFRLCAPSRYKDTVPDMVLPFTARNADGHFTVLPIAQMKSKRVIVCTCVSASVPYGTGMPRGHFSHIFFDEAGQATEPETMVAIKTLADHATNVILSGDPQQLGPIIRSNVARRLGLETSFLARLMSLSIYADAHGRGQTYVKLVQNFRSHPTILKFPNTKFYDGELQACGDATTINAFIGHSILPNKNFPVIFHSIAGQDDREAQSPSFFNIDEATQVKAYIQSLRSDRKARIADKDIAVIAPYHAQCLKIRTILRGVADEVKVGSVEELQGQERKVIIVSTVRSSREFVGYDVKHTLGFIANPRRFNVAVTRAQSLLIIVGDPQVLSLDLLWKSFLNYVHNNRGWTGIPITWDPRSSVPEGDSDLFTRTTTDGAAMDMNQITRMMESLATTDNRLNEDTADANVDRPWREVE